MRRPLVAGNWKMNGSRGVARELVSAIQGGLQGMQAAEVVVCPSFVLLADVAALAAGSALGLGAQDVSEHDKGAYTGEVAASMLAEAGCRYVIVGHSERRQYHGESDERVAAKFMAAQRQDLRPILCVGETLEEREQGSTQEVIQRQLQAVLASAGAQSLIEAVVAYEPVWAIGTGRTASPEQAQQVHAFIRAFVAQADPEAAQQLRILYGGSMKAANAEGLLAQPDIDGGLIGGAALVADDFLGICRQACTRAQR
jgi:triosephosphate isomerase (TIM)